MCKLPSSGPNSLKIIEYLSNVVPHRELASLEESNPDDRIVPISRSASDLIARPNISTSAQRRFRSKHTADDTHYYDSHMVSLSTIKLNCSFLIADKCRSWCERSVDRPSVSRMHSIAQSTHTCAVNRARLRILKAVMPAEDRTCKTFS